MSTTVRLRYLFWLLAVLLTLTLSCQAQPAVPKAHRVILMIADGGGFNQYAAGSYYLHGATGTQAFEKFPVRLAASTFSVKGGYDPALAWTGLDYIKHQATDSAAAATALACGLKSYDAAIGVNPDKVPVPNVVEAFEQAGRSTGVITSVPFSHATPAGFVAHVDQRNKYLEIARQMIATSAVDVIMGAGHPWYNDNGVRGEAPKYTYIAQEQWEALGAGTPQADADGDGKPDAWSLVQTPEEFVRLTTGPTPRRVFGLAEVGSTLQEGRVKTATGLVELKGGPYTSPANDNVPGLPVMARGALNVLGKNPQGFFLMIEGGAVDWACHSNFSGRLVEEMVDFDRAIEAVCQWVSENGGWADTLLIITADHETGCLTGPGTEDKWTPVLGNGAGQLPQMVFHYGSHTNQLVPVFANGPAAAALLTRATKQDPVRGAYLDNTDIARTIFEQCK